MKLNLEILLVFILLCFISCSNLKVIEYKQNENLVSLSVRDYAESLKKDKSIKSLYSVSFNQKNEKKIVSISNRNVKYIYKDRNQIKMEPLKGKLIEKNNNLFYILDSSQTINNYDLAIKYDLIKFDKNYKKRGTIESISNENEKITSYIYCLNDFSKNIKVNYNSWKKYNKAKNKVKCF